MLAAVQHQGQSKNGSQARSLQSKRKARDPQDDNVIMIRFYASALWVMIYRERNIVCISGD